MCAHRPLTRRRLLALTGAATATLAAPALGRAAPALETLDGSAFGTTWRIALPSGADAAGLGAAVQALLDRVDRQMSPYRGDSDLSRFNAAGAGRCAVPGDLVRVTRAALDLAAQSGGSFDPTVGPLVARWGFGPIAGDAQPDWHGLDLGPGGLGKARAGLTLDLCGIAKGYALDGIVDLVDAAGPGACLVDLGGEVFARGRHPSGRAWQVGVEDPRPEAGGMAEVLALEGRAVATSGDRENGYTLGDRRYSHIIAPRTGAPVAGAIASVSVIAETAMAADGWATALMAAGPVAGPALARRQGLTALFLMRVGGDTGGDTGGGALGGLDRVVTGGFDAHLA